MHRRLVALSVALVLAACRPADGERAVEPEPDAGSSATPAPAELPTDAAAPLSLVGEYRVAGIDGEPLDAPVGVVVSIDEETIELAPCASLVWSYIYMDGAIETRRALPPEDRILCRITIEVQAAGEAIDAATRVTRTPSNGIEFSGGGHSVLLFSQ